MKLKLSFITSLLAASVAQGVVITQWDFNAETDKLQASTGTGTASALVATTGFFSDTADGGSSDPNAIGAGGAWALTGGWPAQGTGSGTAGVQFVTSTVGLEDIVVSFDLRPSGSASRWLQFQYTTGSGYIDFGSPLEWATAGENTWYPLSFNLSSITEVNDNADFGFRVVSVFSPNAFSNFQNSYDANEAYQQVRENPTTLTQNYTTSGTWRFDMVTVTSIPEPSAALLGGLGLLALLRRRR